MTGAGPASFPRVPYLLKTRGDHPDDEVVDTTRFSRFLTSPCVVEEKLDGANVTIWMAGDGRLRCAGRSGPGGMDRGRQLGRLRAWVSARDEVLRSLFVSRKELLLYGEWLYRTHTVFYDALPDLLVALDLYAEGGFVAVDERDARCHDAGLATPPVLFRGVLGTVERLRALHARSRFSSEPAEGLVIRLEDGPRLVDRAKVLAPGFRRQADTRWKERGFPLNRTSSPNVAAPIRRSTAARSGGLHRVALRPRWPGRG